MRSGLLPRLTEAMTAWAQGSRLDAQSFAHHFFHRDADDPVVTSLRDAAVGAATATRQDELAAASNHLADAITTEGLDTWPRFIAHALERARHPATLAAVTNSLQPVLPAPAAGKAPGSGRAGKGTKLAQIEEPLPGEPEALPPEGVETPLSSPLKMPPSPLLPLKPDTSEAERGSEPNLLRVPVPAAPSEAPAATPAKAPDANTAGAVKGNAGPPAPRATVSPERRIHILGGDRYGGGHRFGTGKAGKTEFPSNWSDDKIIDEVESVANDPASKRDVQPGGRIKVEGNRDGVEIRVILEPDGITIVTAFPTNLPVNSKGE